MESVSNIDASQFTTGQYQKAFLFLAKAVQETKAGWGFWTLIAKGTYQTRLILKDDATLTEKQAASTKCFIGEQDMFLFDMNEKSLNTPLSADERGEPVKSGISVGTKWPDRENLGACVETLIHEFAVHASEFLPVLAALRDETINLEALQTYLNGLLDGVTGTLTDGYQHYLLASGKSTRFTTLCKYAAKNLSDSEAQAFEKEQQKDMNKEKKNMWLYEELVKQNRVKEPKYPGKNGPPLIDG
jgi:hypothetical protein